MIKILKNLREAKNKLSNFEWEWAEGNYLFVKIVVVEVILVGLQVHYYKIAEFMTYIMKKKRTNFCNKICLFYFAGNVNLEL